MTSDGLSPTQKASLSRYCPIVTRTVTVRLSSTRFYPATLYSIACIPIYGDIVVLLRYPPSIIRLCSLAAGDGELHTAPSAEYMLKLVEYKNRRDMMQRFTRPFPSIPCLSLCVSVFPSSH